MKAIQLAAMRDAQRGDFELADALELVERARCWLDDHDEGRVTCALIETRVQEVPAAASCSPRIFGDDFPKLHGNGGRMRYFVVEFNEADDEYDDERTYDLDGREVDCDTAHYPAGLMTLEHARHVVAVRLGQAVQSASLFPEANACA